MHNYSRNRRSIHKHSNKKPFLFTLIIIAVVAAIGYGVYAFVFNTPTQPASREQLSGSEPDTETNPNRIRLIAGGDVVVHDSINENAASANGAYDYYPMMERFKPIFDDADMAFCNQITPAGGTEFGVDGYPEFNAPTEIVRDLSKLGCNVINMASNHSFDKNQAVIDANVAAWEREEDVLAAVGQNRNPQEREKVHVFEVKGVKIAFLAYTTYINIGAPVQNDYGVNEYSQAFAKRQIEQAKTEGAAIIIASMRWGSEYSPSINPAQENEARFLANQGVDVILGHGPHVLQPVKKISGQDGHEALVWYSLGNFLHTQLEDETIFNGLAVMDFNRQTKKLESFSYLPLYMHYRWSAEDAANENLLAREDPELYLLEDTSNELIAVQQLDTTVAAQEERITKTLNQFIEVPIITSEQYFEED